MLPMVLVPQGAGGEKTFIVLHAINVASLPIFDGTCSLLSAYVNTQKSKFRCFLSIYLKYLRMILSSILMIWLASNKSVAIYAGAKETLRHRPSAAIRIHVAALAKKANNYASRVTGKTAKLG